MLSFANSSMELQTYFFRYAGSVTKNRSMGWALHNAYFTINRAFALAIIFLMALMLDLNTSSTEMAGLCYCAILGAVCANISIAFNEDCVKEKSIEALEIYRSSGSLIKTARKFWMPSNKLLFFRVSVRWFKLTISDKRIFLSALKIHSLYGLSLYLVVFIAANFIEYRATIMQSTAIVNVIATYYLTSVLDPILSRSLDESSNFEMLFKDVLVARYLSYIIICPSVYALFWLIFEV